ncbi:MAG: hypothetical protein AB7G28_25095 [Pirellulales bacterium]
MTTTPRTFTKSDIEKMFAVVRSPEPIPANEFLLAYMESTMGTGTRVIHRCSCGCGQTDKPLNRPEVQAAFRKLCQRVLEMAGVTP